MGAPINVLTAAGNDCFAGPKVQDGAPGPAPPPANQAPHAEALPPPAQDAQQWGADSHGVEEGHAVAALQPHPHAHLRDIFDLDLLRADEPQHSEEQGEREKGGSTSSTRMSLWAHSSPDRLIGWGIPRVADLLVVGSIMYNYLFVTPYGKAPGPLFSDCWLP